MTAMFNKVSAFCGSVGRTCVILLLVFAFLTGGTQTLSMTGFADSENEFDVSLECDGKRTVLTMDVGDTVSDVLKKAEIRLGKLDSVEPSAGSCVGEDDEIIVTRRKIVKRKERVEIPNKTIEIPSSLLKKGVRKTLVEGKPGLRIKTYAQLYVDGEPAEPEYKLDKDVIKSPVSTRVLVGTPGAPVSPLEFDTELDEDGIPVEYENVLQGKRAAGYSARAGAGTASGLPATVGHVAVNPNVIPYGTKMYIRSSDGSFVYGFAIAADTGAALKQGHGTLDLFYGSYMEASLNAIRTVDIYILE